MSSGEVIILIILVCEVLAITFFCWGETRKEKKEYIFAAIVGSLIGLLIGIILAVLLELFATDTIREHTTIESIGGCNSSGECGVKLANGTITRAYFPVIGQDHSICTTLKWK